MTITSVWSAYGHVFIDDEEGVASCLTCGAGYRLVEVTAGRGEYQASNGDQPMYCTRDTSMEHGDPGETGHSLDCEEGCEHCKHDCNCLRCA